MGNCLVTKLKGTVDNIALPEFGKIKIKLERTGDAYLNKGVVIPAIIGMNTIEGDAWIGESSVLENIVSKQIDVSSSANAMYIKFGTGDAYLSVPIDTLTRFRVTYANTNHIDKVLFPLSCFQYLSNLVSIETPVICKGNLADIKELPSIKSISFQSCTFVDGDISNFVKFTGLESIIISATGVTGNIESLASLTSLTNLILNYDTVVGDIKTLADQMHANGRTSGTLYVEVVGADNIQYDGSVHQYKRYNITFSGSGHTDVGGN